MNVGDDFSLSLLAVPLPGPDDGEDGRHSAAEGQDDEKDTQMSPAFLMEQMELREQLESVTETINPIELLAQLDTEIEQSEGKRINELEELFSTANKEQLLRARNLLREMQFLEKLRKEIERKEDELV